MSTRKGQCSLPIVMFARTILGNLHHSLGNFINNNKLKILYTRIGLYSIKLSLSNLCFFILRSYLSLQNYINSLGILTEFFINLNNSEYIIHPFLIICNLSFCPQEKANVNYRLKCSSYNSWESPSLFR